MKNDFSYLLTALLNSFEQAGALYKETADPVLAHYTITEMHCIEKIGRLENPNVTKLAKAMNITRGGISKLVKKIIQRGAVETYVSETNKKEIYYRLTDLGRKVFDAHEKLHKNWRKRDAEFFRKFSEEEIVLGKTFIQKYVKHLDDTLEFFRGRKK